MREILIFKAHKAIAKDRAVGLSYIDECGKKQYSNIFQTIDSDGNKIEFVVENQFINHILKTVVFSNNSQELQN